MTNIRLANYSPGVFDGWKRLNVDALPPHAAGSCADFDYVVGPQTGLDTHAVDVKVRLQPYELRSLDLLSAGKHTFLRAPLPADPLAYFGAPTILGVPLAVLGAEPNGAGYSIHFRARVTPMLVVNVWLRWYPDSPYMAEGEVAVTASNPSIPDLTATVPAGFDLRFGEALVLILGSLMRQPLLPAGMVLADGQTHSFPVTLCWLSRLRSPVHFTTAYATASLGICSNGIKNLWPDGNPVMKRGLNPTTWVRHYWQPAIGCLRGWDTPGLGVNKKSGDTGAQEDQVFVGAEAMAGLEGLGAETVRYLVALGQSRRPCHHLEADGRPLDLAAHPNLVFWDGRAHWHTGVSPDQLGKTGAPSMWDTHGWWGPDVEHWLLNTLAAAARITGSLALQWQLEANAKVYLLQWTVDPRLSTSSTYAARAVGWEGIGVVHLWRTLANRELAAQVRDRWLQRLEAILLPQLSSKPQDIWDVRIDDLRLGAGAWWLPWQQAVGAYGLDLAGQVFEKPAAREVARRAAERVVADAWRQEGGLWLTAPVLPVPTPSRGGEDAPLQLAPQDFERALIAVARDTGVPWSPSLEDGEISLWSQSWNLFGMPLAVATVLRHDATHEKARAIWDSLKGEGGSWIAPGVA